MITITKKFPVGSWVKVVISSHLPKNSIHQVSGYGGYEDRLLLKGSNSTSGYYSWRFKPVQSIKVEDWM